MPATSHRRQWFAHRRCKILISGLTLASVCNGKRKMETGARAARVAAWCGARRIKTAHRRSRLPTAMNQQPCSTPVPLICVCPSYPFSCGSFPDTRVAAWRSGNVVGRINEVTLRQARLVYTGMDDRVRVRHPEAALYFGM